MKVLIAIVLCVFATTVSAELKSNIEYGRADGESLRLDANIPDAGSGPFPVVILVHGGGWSGGDKAADLPLDALTRANFTWFSINYRLAPKQRWPACFEDVQTAIRWVKSHATEFKGDPNRVALLGYSAGGHLAALATVLGGEETRVDAFVGLAPPIDLEIDLPQRGGLSPSLQGLLDRPHELTDESHKILHDLSPINHLHPGLPPTLIIHGDADKSVLHEGSVAYQARLRQLGIRCDLITIHGAPHAIARWPAFDAEYQNKMVSWLKEVLVAAQSATRPSTAAAP